MRKLKKSDVYSLLAVIAVATAAVQMAGSGYRGERRSLQTLESEAADLFREEGYVPYAAAFAGKFFGESKVILHLDRDGRRYAGTVVCTPQRPCKVDSITRLDARPATRLSGNPESF